MPTRGIYDNMKTAVTSVFTGKERVFNRRFLVMASHYMVEPTACSPAAGWEIGQVENQGQTARGRFFQPRLRFASIEELNGWLEAECRRWAELHQHPEQKELTVAQAWAAERGMLQPVVAPFDGFYESEQAVSGTCLINFDRNRYSVMAKAVRRAVQVRAYADRIVVRCDGRSLPTIAEREDGKFEVIAGERRRRAIIHLVRAGTWERDVEIPCKVREPESATGISYAENSQRVAMHPADAIRAFAALAAEGQDEAAIAHRYGYEPREVRKMLALAAVSPKVTNALAADKIDLATAQAFTLTDDHRRQERVLRRARTAHEVRSLLTETKVTTNHRLFRFVGMEGYRAAGGSVTVDLFAKEAEGYADDPQLVQQLADEKLDRLSGEAEAEGWGEVLACETTPYDSYRWHRIYPDAATVTRTLEQKAEAEALLAKRAAAGRGGRRGRSRV